MMMTMMLMINHKRQRSEPLHISSSKATSRPVINKKNEPQNLSDSNEQVPTAHSDKNPPPDKPNVKSKKEDTKRTTKTEHGYKTRKTQSTP